MTEYTPEKVAELVEEANKLALIDRISHEPVAATLTRTVAALTAVTANRDELRSIISEQEKANRRLQSERDKANATGERILADALKVSAERNRLHKAITEALELLQPNAFFSGPNPELTTLDLVGSRRILRAALDRDGKP